MTPIIAMIPKALTTLHATGTSRSTQPCHLPTPPSSFICPVLPFDPQQTRRQNQTAAGPTCVPYVPPTLGFVEGQSRNLIWRVIFFDFRQSRADLFRIFSSFRTSKLFPSHPMVSCHVDFLTCRGNVCFVGESGTQSRGRVSGFGCRLLAGVRVARDLRSIPCSNFDSPKKRGSFQTDVMSRFCPYL